MLKRLSPALLLACLAAASPRARSADLLRPEPSAFLRANAASPVDWMPWGEPAVARAKREQKPVYLFIGSFTSELSSAMRRQTFANPKTAEWLNSHFVCVIVDREEHPEVAALFQAYVVEVKQLGGWPLNLWLTPEFTPFEGAAYLSPSEDWGAPGFLKLASQAEAAWAADPAACRRHAKEAVVQLGGDADHTAHTWSGEKAAARLAKASDTWRAAFDAQRGGFGDPPKSPEPELLRFLLAQSAADREEALATLRSISSSALRDPLDGGFFRYANDGAWRLPYPQKTLSDQARIALAYLEGASGPDAAAFASCARGALDYALAALAHPDGTFAAAVDATGDEYSGYYSWTESEIDKALGPDSAAFKRACAVEPKGNVPQDDDPSGIYAGRNFLRCPPLDASAGAARRLLAQRDSRPAPPRDERATAGAHGLLLSALARAGSQLGEPRYTEAARRTLGAVRTLFLLSPDGALRRFKGADTPAAPEDYAALALGCRDLARATGDRDAKALAARLLGRLDSQFLDPSSGQYFCSPAPAGPGLFARPLCAGDPPSAAALALAAGAPHGPAIAAALSDAMEATNAQVPGDELLALELFAAGGGGRGGAPASEAR